MTAMPLSFKGREAYCLRGSTFVFPLRDLLTLLRAYPVKIVQSAYHKADGFYLFTAFLFAVVNKKTRRTLPC